MAQSNSVMSMFSNLFSGGAPKAPEPPQTSTQGQQSGPAGPGNIPANTPNTGATSSGAAPNGVLPEPGSDLNAAAEDATPFADFKDLWKNEPTATGDANQGVFGQVDPAKFMEAAGKIDFSKAVTPEVLQQITAGGEPAAQAFATAMNKIAQGVYAQSAFATTKIVEQALSRSKEKFLTELPTHIKKQTVTDSLRAENPIFSNPAVQPIINALEAQMTVKFPNATAPEITAMAKQYVEQLGKSFSPKAQESSTTTSGRKGEVDDWDSWLDSGLKQ
jgi:hypothetical protein